MNNEYWQCNSCKHMFSIDAKYAIVLFEHGCAFCGGVDFTLYDLLKELAVC